MKQICSKPSKVKLLPMVSRPLHNLGPEYFPDLLVYHFLPRSLCIATLAFRLFLNMTTLFLLKASQLCFPLPTMLFPQIVIQLIPSFMPLLGYHPLREAVFDHSL